MHATRGTEALSAESHHMWCTSHHWGLPPTIKGIASCVMHIITLSQVMHVTRGTEALSVGSHGIEVLANISPITSHQPLTSHNNRQRCLERWQISDETGEIPAAEWFQKKLHSRILRLWPIEPKHLHFPEWSPLETRFGNKTGKGKRDRVAYCWWTRYHMRWMMPEGG